MEMTDRRLRSYTGARRDLVSLLPHLGSSLPILDVGCSSGATGQLLSEQRGATVIGIELDPTLANEAARHLHRVITGDALDSMQQLVAEGVRVSAVLFGDVLEHLVDPWGCVDIAQRLMPSGGWIVVSIPNVGHWDTFFHLLRGTWPMRERGIHDDTHLRFFARRDLSKLLDRDRSSTMVVRRVYRIVEHSHRINRHSDRVGWIWPNMFTFQFQIAAHVRPLGAELH